MRTDPSGASALLTDALGSTVALTDPAGAVQTQYTYEPFGQTITTGEATGNPINYTGRESDSTGLKYYRARYYHPGLARFIGEDPIGLAGGDVNFYVYVGNNPMNFIDPFGLRIEWGNYVLQNPHVRANLERLNQEIINLGRADADFVLQVTGGDRYVDSAGNIRSATTGEIVRGATPTSPHLVERGARAVDLRVIGVPDAMLDRALRKTEFSSPHTRRDYADRHTHISLPNLQRYYFKPQPSQLPPPLSGRKPQ